MTQTINDPTFLGKVVAVSGSTLTIKLAKSASSGVSIIEGRIYRIGQVGSFVRIPQGYLQMYGIISGVGANAVPENLHTPDDTGRWIEVQLIGESMGTSFERGISQHPNVSDAVHLVIESDLENIYGVEGSGQIVVGNLSSAENIKVRLSLDHLVTRHVAVLGSTGSGKSTTVASLIRSITTGVDKSEYPSARILMLDIHGEYSKALADIANIYSVNPKIGENELVVPYWALDSDELLTFLTGGVSGLQETAFTDKIFELKSKSHAKNDFKGVDTESITVDTPLPFSLRRLWYELIDFETRTNEGPNRDQSTKKAEGDIDQLIAPTYKMHGMGAAGPFLGPRNGILRQLNLMRSRLLDKRYNFLLRPGDWDPSKEGNVVNDLDTLLDGWLGNDKQVTIIDLSGVPSSVLELLIGSILKIVYEALFWSREKSEGGVYRPLLVVMEEAHRYLNKNTKNLAAVVVQRIAKEGRKYGIGAMVVSQRPSEVDDTILSQCGTFIAMRLSNLIDRAQVQGTLPDSLVSLTDLLPVLRTGEAIITGEAARLPMRCRITLPDKKRQPNSSDPEVSSQWSLGKRDESYTRVVASWRAQNPLQVEKRLPLRKTSDSPDNPETENG